MVSQQRFNDLIQISHHDIFKFIECQVDPMIGHSALGEIIGPNPFASVTTANHSFSL